MVELPVAARMRSELPAALAEGPVVLDHLAGDLPQRAVCAVAPDRPVFAIDPRRAGTFGGLLVDIAREALALLLGADAARVGQLSLGSAERVALARAFGPRAQDVLSLAGGELAGAPSLDVLLAGVPAQAVIVVHDAHLLCERWAGGALWNLRARAADPQPPSVVLLTRRWHDAITGRDAAFFGFARRLALTRPTQADWGHALAAAGHPVHPTDLRRLLERTDGHPQLTHEALTNTTKNPLRGWRTCIAARRPQLDTTLEAARAANPLGPRLLYAIARDQAPYAAAPDAKPARVAHALRQLRDHDLIYQPAPRAWQLTDPATATALREQQASRPPWNEPAAASNPAVTTST